MFNSRYILAFGVDERGFKGNSRNRIVVAGCNSEEQLESLKECARIAKADCLGANVTINYGRIRDGRAEYKVVACVVEKLYRAISDSGLSIPARALAEFHSDPPIDPVVTAVYVWDRETRKSIEF